jgi:hypothetical protein
MQVDLKVCRMVSGIAFSLALGLSFAVAHAQTTATGQVLSPGAPGARTGTGCSATDPNTPAAANGTAAPNCLDAGPGFATPSTNMPIGDRAKAVTSLVRVDAVVPRPPVTLPEGDTFSVVGSVTLVKLRRPALDACLATGRRISARAAAATSTTCLNPKGDVMAYQECKAGSTEAAGCTVLTPEDIAKQQTAASAK